MTCEAKASTLRAQRLLTGGRSAAALLQRLHRASELAQRFDMSAPAVSRHLSVLENAGLVTSQRRGQFVHYALNRDSLVTSLTGYAFELCPVGRPLKRESKAIAKARASKGALKSVKG